MAIKKITLNEFRALVQKVISEVDLTATPVQQTGAVKTPVQPTGAAKTFNKATGTAAIAKKGAGINTTAKLKQVFPQFIQNLGIKPNQYPTESIISALRPLIKNFNGEV